MYIALFIIALIAVELFIFLKAPKFGRLPTGARLEKILTSPNYRNGSFQNRSVTPDLTEGATFYSILKDRFFGKHKRLKPIDPIPSVQTDLYALDKKEDVLVWFGHSSYFIQLEGRTLLVDPVLCGNASPVSFTAKAFAGSDGYKPDDIPAIDTLFITHDHWDHMDHETLMQLKPRIGQIVCGLGTGEHLEAWGFDSAIIHEMDWDESIALGNGFNVHSVTGRHFSGRGLKRNQAIWCSFVVQTKSMQLFIGGDSGYDSHFAAAGKKFGSFDLAILENGQYDKSWKYIHMQPEEVLQAAVDLHAKKLLPVHSGKFSISNHPWDEPLSRITTANQSVGLQVLTPMIGEKLELQGHQQFAAWWKNIR